MHPKIADSPTAAEMMLNPTKFKYDISIIETKSINDMYTIGLLNENIVKNTETYLENSCIAFQLSCI